MTTRAEIAGVISLLKQEFVIPSDEWIQMCICYVKRQHGRDLSLQSLKNYVYQKWLTSDLEEISNPSLPPGLPRSGKTTLNECYTLQIDGILDVSRPAYAQLKELQQASNSNAESSAVSNADPEPAETQREATPTRMLMFNLFDGHTRVQAIEMKPIAALNPNLPPGVKVLIKGPVDCKLGFLLLSTENIEVLGGQVESKALEFSRETILKQVLQFENAQESDSSDNDPDTTTTPPNSNSNQLNPPNQPEPSNSDYIAPHQGNNVSINQGSMGQTASPNNQSLESSSAQQSFSDQLISARSHLTNPPPATSSLDMEDFGDDDDFVNSLDYGMLDEIEKESMSRSNSSGAAENAPDICQEDEDMMKEIMAFQDENPGFEMPYTGEELPCATPNSKHGTKETEPFTYLSSLPKTPSSECLVTIKGFIINVLSKLECTVGKGWSLCVRINDGTDVLDVNVHDKVLEGIIGISAAAMVKLQILASVNPDKKKEVMGAISKCKTTLKNFNGMMDIKVSPNSKPSLVKCYPMAEVHVQQLLDRVKSS